MTSFEIHPAIGIARLGSSTLHSPDGFFIGPEPDSTPPASYRDPSGDLKRQAARFRLFRCTRDDHGRLLQADEQTLADMRTLTWTVRLANRKGTARRQYGTRPGFRNNWIDHGGQHDPLIIDPAPRSVSAAGERQHFDTGRFRTTPVFLGEIEMEPGGRLLVLGGHGRSGSDPPQSRLTQQSGHFADNDNWFDDASDGAVTATFELPDGTTQQATAWVIVGPPDFAPGITNLVTLYDLLFDWGVKRGILTAPTDSPGAVSFSRHVQPILARAMGYRWVNRPAAFGYTGHGTGHASGGTGDFASRWAALADPSPSHRELRETIAGRLRNPDPRGAQPYTHPLNLLPRLSDHQWMNDGPDNVLPLTTTQYKIMQAWASGDFVNDRGCSSPSGELVPDALTRMALEACVGAALFPGIEVNGYIMNFPERFVDGDPFRISHEKVSPGEVTQYNAVPWQADFQLCSWQETQGILPKRLGWWPAQRPDDVFPAVGAAEMLPWARGLGSDFQDMIDKWHRLGIVVDRGPPGGPPFFVETERDSVALGP
jgi:hypothetical protein